MGSAKRAQKSGQALRVRMTDPASLPSIEPYVPALESLDEICEWLGTFQERLRLAHSEERAHFTAMVEDLQLRYQVRRAELS